MPDGTADRLHLVRITLEALSPLSIGSGESRSEARTETTSDGKKTNAQIIVAGIQRDANGLPTIPGPGLQGALRSLAEEAYDEQFAKETFGHEEETDSDGRAGCINWGWACAHDSGGEAVSGLRLEGLDTKNDSVLQLLNNPEPVWRDHVALSGRHSVDGRRKFARAAVPVGTRFSVELSGWGGDSFLKDLKRIVALFRHPRLRLGSGSGRGYGRVALRAASYAASPIDEADALRCQRQQPPSSPLDTSLLEELAEPDFGDDTVLTLNLECEDPIRIGAADQHAKHLTHRAGSARDARTGQTKNAGRVDGGSEGKDGVLLLMREPYIAWDKDGRGRVVDIESEADTVPPEQMRFPVPGSAIRGPLAHRTLFHANGAAGRCIDADEWKGADDEKREEYEARDQALRDFFGSANKAQSPDREAGDGRAGRVLFDDSEICGATWVMGIDHVSIDRFTGGVREITGALFREEVLLGGRIDATIIIRPRIAPSNDGSAVGGWPRETAEAFLRALRDLCRGRLALGGRSHGTCRGTVRFEGRHAEAWRDAARNVDAPLGEAKE